LKYWEWALSEKEDCHLVDQVIGSLYSMTNLEVLGMGFK